MSTGERHQQASTGQRAHNSRSRLYP